ncbi:pyridine nucleotide-disulfide oxidoreductase-domain-containing protein [Sordaria brevicollis]|uniref:Pyridine nucleotide-disulfide oxidoreductase-domain-containing protein n=1 Tax=Sordaria brevicollis TaxID=83679 RepID=A0AAE0P1K5_SORBR|nr:pyridine nucleotide-disulfide oxidoreductase-domain-containing protein [Sordaria brevicollis]
MSVLMWCCVKGGARANINASRLKSQDGFHHTLREDLFLFPQGVHPVSTAGLDGEKFFDHNDRKERVVILGSGWAGYSFAKDLDPEKYERIVISPRSYFVFTPLLASTAVGTLEFRTVLEPIRRLNHGIGFHQGWAQDIDFANKTIRVEANANADSASKAVVPIGQGGQLNQATARGALFDVPYDKLVIACGAYSQTFGIEGVREHANFLRDVGDARRIRLRILSLFEQCAYPKGSGTLTDEDRANLLHFAIVGGGPTGIEFASELHDLIHDDLSKMYPDLLKFVRITVYDVSPKVLPMFDQALSKYAMDAFKRQKIEIRTQHNIERVRLADGKLGSEHGELKLKIKQYGDKEVGAGLVVWSTGLMANPLIKQLASKDFAVPISPEDRAEARRPKAKLATDARTGGILVDEHFRVRIEPQAAEAAKGSEVVPTSGSNSLLRDVFVLGDAAVIESQRTLPKTAQVAAQQATYLAKVLNKANEGVVDVKNAPGFKFRNWGVMTYLGSWKAIHQGPRDELRGWAAWVLWRSAYLAKSMSLRNKFLVPVYWLVSWIFGRGISRF